MARSHAAAAAVTPPSPPPPPPVDESADRMMRLISDADTEMHQAQAFLGCLLMLTSAASEERLEMTGFELYCVLHSLQERLRCVSQYLDDAGPSASAANRRT